VSNKKHWFSYSVATVYPNEHDPVQMFRQVAHYDPIQNLILGLVMTGESKMAHQKNNMARTLSFSFLRLGGNGIFPLRQAHPDTF
jgi:hypothetical protein